ncbi:HD-GYP domain-containing protein [Paenibacillus sp. IB182496]|uniref:HD-GYP domain-containing protein n=1 Tax=Paenibacillus sabuli TaxID=2772509 RepID=A0A927BZW7_9BACL|nr:HD-GYP domain-containing protein [Paenibacillus sabuli]
MDVLLHKSSETYHHCVRVALLSERMGQALHMSRRSIDRLMRGCFVHDLGKVMLPREILTKKAPLNAKEWTIMKLHPLLGADLLELGKGMEPEVVEMVRHHHERWDGTGYPSGLKGEEIPFYSRLCAVVDAFDSMISDRPYRRALTVQEAKEELHRGSGTQFDRRMVRLFLDVYEEVPMMYVDRPLQLASQRS